LNENDEYGKGVAFQIKKGKPTITTSFGGFMTLTFYTLLAVFVYQSIHKIYIYGKTKFYTSDYSVDVKELGRRSMDEFDDTFNLFMGTSAPVDEFDWFDNEYVTPNVYEITHKWHPTRS